jgi:tetratricopeptide (TPR) repeat protein
LISKGSGYYANGFFEKAVEAFDNTTKLEPSNHAAWFYLEQALEKVGRDKDAEAAFAKADELSNQSTTTYGGRHLETTLLPSTHGSSGGIPAAEELTTSTWLRRTSSIGTA